MSQDNLITLKYTHKHTDDNGDETGETSNEYITTSKNKKKLANADKLTLKKFSKKAQKRVVFKETKKMFKK